jgi:hypothetical protein
MNTRISRNRLKLAHRSSPAVLIIVCVLPLLVISIILFTSCELIEDLAVVVVWLSNEDLGGAGSDDDIFFSRSTDNGDTWKDVQVLNSNATADTGVDWNPQAATEGSGTWVAVWESEEDIDGSGFDFDIIFSRSIDNGASWSIPQLLNSTAASDTLTDKFPQVMTDGSGVWVVVWESNENIDGAGNDYDIFFSRSTDNGVTWGNAQALNTNAALDSSSDERATVMYGGDKTWITVWRSNEDYGGSGTDSDLLLARSADNGATWSAPQLLNSNATTDISYEYQPSVMSDGSGTWVTVWFSNEDIGGTGTDRDIFFSRSADNGLTWGAEQILNTNAASDTGYDWRPVIMTDGDGIWITAWISREDPGGVTGTDSDIFFARSVDNGATWSAPQALNTNAGTDTGTDIRPKVFSNGADTWIAVWQSNENLDGAGTDDDILFSKSTDDGLTWSAPGLLNSNASDDSGYDQFANAYGE